MNHSFFTTNPFLGITIQKIGHKIDSRRITVHHRKALQSEVNCILIDMLFC